MTTVTHKTIVVFIPALDGEVDVQRNPDASVQNGSVPEVGDIATVKVVLDGGDYAATAATFVPSGTTGKTLQSQMTTFFCLMTKMRIQRNTTGKTSLP